MNAAVATRMPVTTEVTSDYSGSLTPTSSGDEESEEEEEEEDERRVSESSSLLWAGTGAKRTAFIMFRPESLISKDKRLKAIGEKYHLAYKMVKTESKLVRSVLTTYGFHEVHPNSPDFNLMWTGAHLKPFSLRSLQDFQKVNHFPRSYEITRKDRLFKNVDRMAHTKGAKHFDFMPKSYLMPSEYQDFCAAYAKDKGPWIVKPIASSRGRGIYLINNPNQVPLEDNIMVCKYISNPLLIDGFKFDIRVYIAVTSYDPLIIYLFEEGLTRFATVKYEKTHRHLKNQMMHLTNYSINKKSHDYVRCEDPDVEDYGNKWSMSAMLRYLKQEGIDTSALMMRIEAVIIKAIVAAELPIATACKMFVPHRENCMELYGFDILVDENLKPWLLEGNLSPSLACDAPLDLKIKSCMVSDFFSLVGFQCVDPLTRRQKKDQTRRPYSASKGLSGVSSMQGTQVKRPVSASGPKEPSVSGLSNEEAKILKMAKEQYQRRGSFIRIFPTPETWELYGSFLEYKSNHNLMLAQKLFPERARSKVTGAYSSAVARMRSIASGQLLEGRNRVMSERFLQYERKLLSLESLKNKRTKKTVTKKRKKETPIGVDNKTLAQGQLKKVTRNHESEESEGDDVSDTDSDISDDSQTKKSPQKATSSSQSTSQLSSTTKISSAGTTRSKKSVAAKATGAAGDLNPLTKSAYASARMKDLALTRPPSQGSSVIASSSRTSISSRSGTAKSVRKVEKPQENMQKQTPSQRIYTYKNSKLDAGDTKSNAMQDKAKPGNDSSSDCDSSNDVHVKDGKMKRHDQQSKPTTSAAKQSSTATPRTAKQQKKAFDVLHALKSGGNLGKVQARQAFSAYLSRVQQRLMAESESHSQESSETVSKQEDQMDLVLRFLKRAAGNLRQSFAVVVPSRRLSLPDRKRILAKQLGDFVHIYNKETDVMEHKQSLGLEKDTTPAWSESVQENTVIKETDFRYFVLTASEPELEEVLTTYTHKNKSASVFLGASKPKSREKREVSTPSTVASTSRLATRGRMSAVDHFPSSQSLVHTGHMYQSEEHREDLYELNLHRRSQSAFSTLRMRSPSPAASVSSMSIRNPYHPSTTYLHPTQGTALSSLQQASYVYNSKLTPPTSVTNAVASQNSAQKRPSSARDFNGQPTNQATSTSNPVGTRPTSASNGRVTVGGSLHYQTAANEEAIADALQKLAERQAARQYSATSQLQALTQHLSNINLANLSASRQQLNHRTSSLSDLVSNDPAVQSMMEPSSWEPETTNKYASRPPQSQPQVLAQQSKELLQQSKAKHQAMVAQVARMVDDFGSQLKLEFQSAIDSRATRRCSFLDSLLTEGEEESEEEDAQEGRRCSAVIKIDQYNFPRSKLPETSYYYRKAAEPSIVVQNQTSEFIEKKNKGTSKISVKKTIEIQQVPRNYIDKKSVKEKKQTYKPGKYAQNDDVRPKSRAERVWISYHEHTPKKVVKSPRNTKQDKQTCPTRQKQSESRQGSKKNCSTCGTITYKNAMDLAKNSPQSENIIKSILNDMKVFSSGDSPCKQWVYQMSGSPSARSWTSDKTQKKKIKKAHNMVSAGVDVRSPYAPQSGDDSSNILKQRPGSASSAAARPPQVPRPPEKPKPTEKNAAPTIRKPLGNTTKISHVGSHPQLTGLSPNPSSIKSNEDRQRNFYNSFKYDTSTGQTKLVDKTQDVDNPRPVNNTEAGSRPSSARRPLWKP